MIGTIEKFANQSMFTMCLVLSLCGMVILVLSILTGPVIPSVILGAVFYHYILRDYFTGGGR
jgi:hypothetical protein